MQTTTIDHGNGNSTTYKKIGGMWFHVDTDQKVCELLNSLRANKTRVKIYLGDINTGRAWVEEFENTGTIGCSTGNVQIPLLISKPTAPGGSAILDNCIVGIRTVDGKMLYSHSNFAAPNVEIREGSDLKGYTYETWVNGELHGRHKSLRSAQICRNRIV